MTIGNLWTADQVADHLGIKRNSVYRMANKSPDFPQPQHAGRTPLWDPEAVKAWRATHPTRKNKDTDSPAG